MLEGIFVMGSYGVLVVVVEVEFFAASKAAFKSARALFVAVIKSARAFSIATLRVVTKLRNEAANFSIA